MWSNTRRGAQFLDGTLPKIARALERIARALENQVEADEEDITRRVLNRAFEMTGGRSIHIAEMIDDLERKKYGEEASKNFVAEWIRLKHKKLGVTDFLEPYIHMVMGMIDREELRVEVREEDLIFIYPEHKP